MRRGNLHPETRTISEQIKSANPTPQQQTKKEWLLKEIANYKKNPGHTRAERADRKRTLDNLNAELKQLENNEIHNEMTNGRTPQVIGVANAKQKIALYRERLGWCKPATKADIETVESFAKLAESNPEQALANLDAFDLYLNDKVAAATQPTGATIDAEAQAKATRNATSAIGEGIVTRLDGTIVSQMEINALEYARKYLSTKSQAPTVSERGRSPESMKIADRLFDVQ